MTSIRDTVRKQLETASDVETASFAGSHKTIGNAVAKLRSMSLIIGKLQKNKIFKNANVDLEAAGGKISLILEVEVSNKSVPLAIPYFAKAIGAPAPKYTHGDKAAPDVVFRVKGMEAKFFPDSNIFSVSMK